MNSFTTLTKQQRINLLAAKAYNWQVGCWYAKLVSELISLNTLQSLDEATLRSYMRQWAALLNTSSSSLDINSILY